MHYVVAAAMVDGAVNLATFTPEKIADDRIGSLLAKVRMEADQRVEGSSEFSAIVTAKTRSGKSGEHRVELAIGKPARWLERDQLRSKFVECASYAISQNNAERAFERFTGLVKAPRLSAELETLVP
jgi:2-methylcitrate dehydratase PrpD